jgi:AcrR family transcriptional regulator
VGRIQAEGDRVAQAPGVQHIGNFGQARRLLKEAALELFAERGFSRASTRSIADRAGVSEALIYRHFGSKVGLFEQAVLEPIQSFINGYVNRWGEVYSHEPISEESIRDYVTGLYELMRTHRLAVISLLAEYSFGGSGGSHEWKPLFGAVIESLDDVTRRALDRRGFTRGDPALNLRANSSLVLGMALLDEFLFGAEEAKSRQEDEIVDELVSIVVGGVS